MDSSGKNRATVVVPIIMVAAAAIMMTLWFFAPNALLMVGKIAIMGVIILGGCGIVVAIAVGGCMVSIALVERSWTFGILCAVICSLGAIYAAIIVYNVIVNQLFG